jgi:uncharacterized membrane protein
MIITTDKKRFIAAAGIAASAFAAPALLLAGAATAHADDSCYGGTLSGSYYCSPASGSSAFGSVAPDPVYQPTTIGSTMWSSLPGCSGGVLAALDGDCS